MMRQFENRVIRHIRATHPEYCRSRSDDQIRLQVQAGIRKAGRYSIVEDDDVEQFILLLVDRGMEFEKAPDMAECREILENPKLPGDAKVALVYRALAADSSEPGESDNPPET